MNDLPKRNNEQGEEDELMTQPGGATPLLAGSLTAAPPNTEACHSGSSTIGGQGSAPIHIVSNNEQGALNKAGVQDDEVVDVEATTSSPNNDEGDDQQHQENNQEGRKMVAADAPWTSRMWEVFTTFWPLGLIAFGGPQAHIAILRDHLVIQRNWLDEEAFVQLFAIGQSLPGATSTQLVVSCAVSRAGPLGGILALFLWSFPSLVVLTVSGMLIDAYVDPNNPPWYLIGLPPAAISLVFKAFYGFAIKLDTLGTTLALCSCLATILIANDKSISPTSSQFVFPTMMALGAITTLVDSQRAMPFANYGSPPRKEDDDTLKRIGISRMAGAGMFLLWVVVLVVAVVLVEVQKVDNVYFNMFGIMFRVGSLIFGGGQVVLPMLQGEVVPFWMTKAQFLQGLGLSQSLPGPLFNFAAYLGAVYKGVPGAIVAFLGLMGPGIILIFGVIPFWAHLRYNQTFRVILHGLNATAIGLVGAACVILWESAISGAADAMVFSVALTMAVSFNIAAPFCILAGGVIGAILSPDALDLGQVPYCINQGFEQPRNTSVTK